MRITAIVMIAALFGSGVPAHAADALIAGFRSAHFGMTEAELRAAIARDFPGSALAITAQDDAGQRTLSIPLIRLNPGPMPAAVAYALRSGRLVQIDVTWAAPGDPSPTQREGLFRAGERLRRYFEAQAEKPVRIAPPGVLGPNSLLLYGAADRQGARMEALVEGVAFERLVDGKAIRSPEPAGAAVLRVSYRAGKLADKADPKP